MATSLSSSPLLFVAAAARDNSDDLATALFVFVLLLAPFVLLTVALWNKRAPRSHAPSQSQQTAGGNHAPIRATNAAEASYVANTIHAAGTPSVAHAAPALLRRVITLHSTTPGQSPFEYNIGDNQGTRGSAQVRAA